LGEDCIEASSGAYGVRKVDGREQVVARPDERPGPLAAGACTRWRAGTGANQIMRRLDPRRATAGMPVVVGHCAEDHLTGMARKPPPSGRGRIVRGRVGSMRPQPSDKMYIVPRATAGHAGSHACEEDAPGEACGCGTIQVRLPERESFQGEIQADLPRAPSLRQELTESNLGKRKSFEPSGVGISGLPAGEDVNCRSRVIRGC
jgi:hypothetical protein